jgi:hypothetical protein
MILVPRSFSCSIPVSKLSFMSSHQLMGLVVSIPGKNVGLTLYSPDSLDLRVAFVLQMQISGKSK